MANIINRIVLYLKVILLLYIFTLTLYIMLMMNDCFGNQITNIFLVSLPLLLVLIIFVLNLFFNQNRHNTFFNIGCFLALIAILMIDLRTIFDENMVSWVKNGMNYYYFQNQMTQIKLLCYLMFVGNLLLFCSHAKKFESYIN